MVGFQNASIFGEAGSQKNGKSDLEGSAGASPPCPQCGGKRLWRDGLRYSIFGDQIQRWLCRDCGLRFSDPEDVKNSWSEFEKITRNREESLKARSDLASTRQICVEETKNLDPEQTIIQQVPGRMEDVKGKLVEFAWKLQQEGYAYETVRVNGSCLRTLMSKGANIADPSSVKDVLAREQKWSPARKRNAINAYTLFLKVNGLMWSKPKCVVPQKFPFIPVEQEIDALIAGSGRKNAAYLQLLKETAMRSGEAKRLQWIDIDHEKSVVTLNQPEKGSNPRMWRVTATLIEMINALPKSSPQVFTGSLRAMKTTFGKARRRIAQNLQTPDC